MQEYIWVLCEELDTTECFDETRTKNIWTFNDFESAKTALRKLMRIRAFSLCVDKLREVKKIQSK